MAAITSNSFSTSTPSISSTSAIPPNHPIVGNRLIYGEGTPAQAWQHWQALPMLTKLNLATHFPKQQRVCIFAPHPDDEILGCAGLMLQLVEQGNSVLLVSVTNGTKSHPNSSLYSPAQLDSIRPQETQQALKMLGIFDKVQQLTLGMADGEVIDYQPQLNQKLASFLTQQDILVPTFRLDGHPDHETVGKVVLNYARQHGLICYQVLIWALHWASPGDERINWQQVLRLDLTAKQQQKKQQAIACFPSQILPDESTGQSPVLPPFAIARATQGWELFIHESA